MIVEAICGRKEYGIAPVVRHCRGIGDGCGTVHVYPATVPSLFGPQIMHSVAYDDGVTGSRPRGWLAVQKGLLGGEPLEAGECCEWDWGVGIHSGLLGDFQVVKPFT